MTNKYKWIQQSEEKLKTSGYGELCGKYDYSKIPENVKSHDHITITCPEHGDFEMSMSNFKHKPGCPQCKQKIRLRNDGEEWIKKAKSIWGEDTYDYSEVDYKGKNKLVKIICKKHNEAFYKRPHDHTDMGEKNQGCPQCGKHIPTLQEYINECNKKFDGKYDYSLVDSIYPFTKKIKIKCKNCGKEFESQANLHLRMGYGCPRCNCGYSKQEKLQLINDCDLEYMTNSALIEIISMGNLPVDFKTLLTSEPGTIERKNALKELKDKYESDKSDDEINAEIDKEIADATEKYEQSLDDDDCNNYVDNSQEIADKLRAKNILRSVHANADYNISFTSDGDGMRFIIEESKQRLWDEAVRNPEFVEMIKEDNGNAPLFQQIKLEFLNEFNIVDNLEYDKNYKFPYPLNLMQKVTAYNISTRKYYGNWSGTGAGKSLSRDFTSRLIDSHSNLYIVPNSVIDTTVKSILEVYPDSNIEIISSVEDIHSFATTKYNYHIINYEKFQQENTKELIEVMLSTNIYDFVCLDEIQNVKVTDPNNPSIRYQFVLALLNKLRDLNPTLKVLALSATPIINNINEVKSILELISGEVQEMSINRSIKNMHEAYKKFKLNGVRFVPKYKINVNTIQTNIFADDELSTEIKNSIINEDPDKPKYICFSEIDKVTAGPKIQHLLDKNEIKKHTIIYSHFIEGIQMVYDILTNAGFSVVKYTGNESEEERKHNICKFINGEVDILLGSDPITTGVDGLQNVCNRMVILSAPWTHATYTQLIGRIYRQGSKFDNVDVLIPIVKVDHSWSLDKYRLSIIEEKRTLSEAVMDGVFNNVCDENACRKQLLEQAKQAIKNGLHDTIAPHNKLNPEITINIQAPEHKESFVQDFTRLGKTTKSSTFHEKMLADNSDWFKYHEIRNERMKEWPEIPYEYIASQIKNPNRVIADFGCGFAGLSKIVPNKVYSLDHVACNDDVIVCDMTNTGLPDASIDYAVFSLSLWGTNHEDYFTEAYRVLGYDGHIYIAEPAKNYDEEARENLKQQLISVGFKNVTIEDRGKFFYVFATK